MTNLKSKIFKKERAFYLFNLLYWFTHWIFWFLADRIITFDLKTILGHFTQYFTAFLLSCGLRYIFKKTQLSKLHLFKIIFVIIFTSFFCGIIWSISWNAIEYKLWNFPFYSNIYNYLKRVWFLASLFFAWSLLYLGFKFYEEFLTQKENASKAEMLAKQAQLEMLRYQLNPHFLFNTLSSLRALIRKKDNNTAEVVVTKISEFLKYSLLEGDESKVSLSREIKTINHYFDIEKVRFGDQLKIEYTIDPATEKFQVPVFLIHPLIENAVKHGMKTSPFPLKISIVTKLMNRNLLIEIYNSGQWIEREPNEDNIRTGIQNTRKRLRLAYPDNHTFLIIKKENLVCIRIIINDNN